MPPRKARLTRTARDVGPMPDVSVMFGWCLPDDGNHGGCRRLFTSTATGATYTCSCPCHGGTD